MSVRALQKVYKPKKILVLDRTLVPEFNSQLRYQLTKNL